MKKLPALFILAPLLFLISSRENKKNPMWVTGYYAGWRQKHMRPEQIDYSAITHLVHFAVDPKPDGTLDAEINVLSASNIAAAVDAAHRADKKILFSVGGQDTRKNFISAFSERHRAAFIGNLIKFMKEHHYDGIDVDMEEIKPEDHAAFIRFIETLRAELDRCEPRPMLTAAALWEPSVFARLAPRFDQINLMSYRLAGAYPGWVSWHSGAVYDGGQRMPDGSKLPTVDGLVDDFIAAGVPKSKLGIGLCFNGYVWSGSGISKPRQGWENPPVVKDIPYYTLAEIYNIKEYDYSHPAYVWDSKAEAAYLSLNHADPTQAQFISYDNEVTARKKVRYIQRKGLGGLTIWELGAGFRASRPAGKRDILLQAVKRAVFGK